MLMPGLYDKNVLFIPKNLCAYGGCAYVQMRQGNFSKCVKNIMAYIVIENEYLVRY